MTVNDLAQGVTAGTISLLYGHPDPVTLLTPELQEAIQATFQQPQAFRILQYGPEQGTAALINFLVNKINQEWGLALAPANIMITAGATHAGDMTARPYAG